MKTILYKGYQASVEFDDGSLFVKVLHIDDLLIAECDKASDAENAARELIDAYIIDCQEAGRQPDKPFKGSLNIRIGPDLHRGAAIAAAEMQVTLNGWINTAIQEKLECSRLTERLDGVMKVTAERFGRSVLKTKRDTATHEIHMHIPRWGKGGGQVVTANFPRLSKAMHGRKIHA